MKLLKILFSNWTPARFLRLALGVIAGIVYAFDGQGIYLLFSVFLLVQAVLNMCCGCAADNCTADVKKGKKTSFDFEKLNTIKKDV